MKWFKIPFTKPEGKDKIVKVTNSGRVYIETEDFFKQEEIINTIRALADSDLIRQIDINNKKRYENEQQLISD